MASGSTETEIKLPVHDVSKTGQNLLRLGFSLQTARTFEANSIYDTAASTLRGSGCLLRLRVYGDNIVLTFKGASQPGRHKTREEIETTVQSPEAMHQILERLGYQIGFRYEKYRTEWSDGAGMAVIDETSIGNYLELEGNSDWIDRIAAELGYGEADYITKSYGTLYNEYRASHPGTKSDMVFGNEP
jgi:adenylate cyclase, class 2